MSLTSSNRSDSATDSPIDVHIHGGAVNGCSSGSVSSAGVTGGGTGSPLSNGSPVSLPTHALSYFHHDGDDRWSARASVDTAAVARESGELGDTGAVVPGDVGEYEANERWEQATIDALEVVRSIVVKRKRSRTGRPVAGDGGGG